MADEELSKGVWVGIPKLVIPQGRHIDVPIVLITDSPAVTSSVLKSPNGIYHIRRSLANTHSHVKIMLANRLRRLPGPEVVFEPGEEVVVKIWNRPFFESSDFDEKPRGELAAMQLLSAVGDLRFNRLLDYCQEGTYVFMVIPYMHGGDLYERLFQNGEPLPEDKAKTVMTGIMQHLAFMKHHGFAHRDISLENVMMNAGGTYNLIDLGMSVRMPTFVSGAAVYAQGGFLGGKPSYISPEVAQAAELVDPFATDVWALGIILYILLTRSPIYTKVGDVSFRWVCEGRLEELLNHYQGLGLVISPLALQLITRMLCLDPSQRLTLEEAIEHPWMQAEPTHSSGPNKEVASTESH